MLLLAMYGLNMLKKERLMVIRQFKYGSVLYSYVLKPRYYLRRLQIKLVKIFNKEKASEINAKAKADYKAMPLKYLLIIGGERINKSTLKGGE